MARNEAHPREIESFANAEERTIGSGGDLAREPHAKRRARLRWRPLLAFVLLLGCATAILCAAGLPSIASATTVDAQEAVPAGEELMSTPPPRKF